MSRCAQRVVSKHGIFLSDRQCHSFTVEYGAACMVRCRENGRKVTLPAAIFVNRVKTLGDTLKGMKTIEEKQAELFGIWSQLAKVLKMFHQRGWYLRDVTYENVVHVRMGATEGWTLLEFGNASRPKSSIAKNTIPARQCPPEVRRPPLQPLAAYCAVFSTLVVVQRACVCAVSRKPKSAYCTVCCIVPCTCVCSHVRIGWC